MAFDQATRNRLARFVSDARALLTEEFTRQLQLDYGLDPASGARTELDKLGQLDDARRATAAVLRETLDHYLAASAGKGKQAAQEALDRIVREQAFTVLNRLCALRMAEARDLVIESVAQGYQSRGFQLYSRLASAALGETGDAYRVYLFSLFDELAIDLPVLFDRFAPEGRLFPREAALLGLLDLLNAPDLAELWAADETIGWVYQYFNSQEERRKMRAESQAPRNSRELAVRNQFFTPRYVVEFLADNTLGRTWYEMTQGQTGLADTCRYLVCRPNEIFLQPGEQAPAQGELAEGLSQEELLRQPVYIPHRTLKDPRAIRLLDPACGSMHFGLYAFDLFERIYEEAWELEAERGPEALERAPLDAPLHEAYADKETFLREVPRLIVERNIHGVDIDPRAVQIAGLALWLRAQRSWRERGVKAQDRPQIRRSNVVCAEPMPGDPALLDEFVARELAATPEDRVVAQMLRRVFKAMALAGEAGSLLKIEEEIAAIVAEGKRAWRRGPSYDQTSFLPDAAPRSRQSTLDIDASGITDERFWQRAEERIYAALEDYAGFAEGSGAFRRRLFADDARQGFAFIELCRKRYDVVLMNPPFGDTSANISERIREWYTGFSDNLFATFHYRAHLLAHEGFIGMISSRTFITYRDFERFRDYLINVAPLTCLADLGWEVLDGAQVETAAFVTGNKIGERMLFGPFFRLLNVDANEKESKLLLAVNQELRKNTFFAVKDSLETLPGKPLCYWSGQGFLRVVKVAVPMFPEIAFVGLGASPHAFFFRAWWEINAPEIALRWQRICRGGDYSPFYRSNALVIDWKRNGGSVKEYILQKYPYLNGNYGWKVQDEDKYGLPGLTWGKRNERFNVQAMPAGHIFTDEGQGIVPSSKEYSLFLLGYVNSSVIAYFLSLTSGLQKHYVYVRPIPIIETSRDIRRKISEATSQILFIKQNWDTTSELSPLFSLPLPQAFLKENSIRVACALATHHWSGDADRLIQLRAAINDSVFEKTRLSNDDIDEIQELVSTFPQDVPNNEGFLGNHLDKEMLITAGLQVYISGCIFGRWDIRYATGERAAPELPDPFAPLPVCPPGMLQNAQGLPATSDEDIVSVGSRQRAEGSPEPEGRRQKAEGSPEPVDRRQKAESSEGSEGSDDLPTAYSLLPTEQPTNYPLRISWPGILVDDEDHAEDIVGRVREAIGVIWGERAEAIEAEACEILGVKGLREYFARPAGFFADHLARYSKSRRQAPIYWPLSTASGSYTLWLYYHRLSDQTLYSCVNDFVEPKLKQVGEELLRLRQKPNRSRTEERELERLSVLAGELNDLRGELLRVAAFWKPNLNDGVQITAAPLWRLFAHKPWHKRLKETWEQLEKGEYDWAHLAYSIWPERVREKCKSDKSLAIAHDLEALYVAPPASAKKRGRAKKVAEDEEAGE